MPAHLLPISRRGFLAASSASLATLGHTRLSGAEPTANPDSWVLLSDTHLLSAASIQQHYAADKVARERRATVVSKNFDLAAVQVNAMREKPAGMILNGDCVHVGGADEYNQLARKFALFRETPIHVTMGNHDHRDDFFNAFRNQRNDAGVLLMKRHVSVLKSRHANFVLLDSLTMKTPNRPVKGPGLLGAEQLEWFESVLDAESDKPTIVVFHHNIDPSEDYQKRSGAQEIIVESAGQFNGLGGGVEDSDRLLDLLQTKPHVKAVVTGHMHQFRIFKWRQVHFISLPSVGYTFDVKEPVGWMQVQLQEDGAAFELRTLDTKHARHRTRVKLNWS